MVSGTLDYGDYEGGEHKLCSCGKWVDPAAKMCKSCARYVEWMGKEERDLSLKLGRHRIHKWWLATMTAEDITAAFEEELRMQVINAFEEIASAQA